MEVIKLNLIPGKACPVVHISQFDDGREFKAELYEGVNVYTLDGTETLTAIVKKPDGNEVTAAVTNTSDNYVIITTTEQMTACAGGNLGTLRIEKGAATIATLNFILECQASPDTGIQSDSEIHNFEAQVNQMVEDALASQYDSANVIFDNLPTAGHGIPYTVTSEGIGNAIDDALEMTDTASGAIATFESEYALPLRDLEIEINAVETGDGNPKSPSNPYTISGLTSANITACGKNLFKYSRATTGIYLDADGNEQSSTSFGITEFLPVSSQGIRYRGATNFGTAPCTCYYDRNKTFISSEHHTVGYGNLTIPASAVYFRMSFRLTDNTTLMIKVGTTPEDYEAYNGTTYSISWNDVAGTVYGAKSKPIVGGFAVTYGSVDLGDLTWSNASGNLSSSSGISTDVKAPSANTEAFKGLCSCYEISARTGISDKQISVQTNGNIVISDTGIAGMTGAQIKTYLTGFVLVYELAIPVEYTLESIQPIITLQGTNNIYTDTNGDTSLEYYAGNGAETAQVAEEIAGVVVADYAAKVVKTKNGTFTNLLASPLNSVWLICCQKVTTAGSGFVGIYSFDGVNLNPCVVYINDMSASFDSATGTITVKYSGSTTDVHGSAFRLA